MSKCPITGLPCNHKKCIHVTEVANFQAIELKSMCVACGLPYIAKEGGPQFDPTVQKVFDMIDSVIKDTEVKQGGVVLQPVPVGCPGCGHTLEDIVMTGKVGCGNCYSYYKKELLPLIEKCQASATKHGGKIPKNHYKPVTLEQLEADLKKAIEKEEYEKANIIKREIERLK